MSNLAALVINQIAAVAQSDTYTQAVSLTANIPQNITIPTDSATGLKAGYVVFGSSVSTDFYARTFGTQSGHDRITNGTFAEYVTNGTFSSDTGWTKGAGWTIAAGVATATGGISTAISQTSAITLLQGYTYTITYTITRSAGSLIPSIGGQAGVARSASGTYTETIVAGADQTLLFTGVAFTGTLDTVTVTAWVLGTGWTTNGTVATATGAISTAISQTANPLYTIVQGQGYLVTYTVTASAGNITPSLGGTAGTARSTSATFSEVIIAGATQAISFGTSGFTGTLTNVSIVAVAQVPGTTTTGYAPRENPVGFALGTNATYVSVSSASASIVTASFFKR